MTFCAAAERNHVAGRSERRRQKHDHESAGWVDSSESGNARINEFDIVAQRIAAQRSLAYLPQRPSFHPRMTCARNFAFLRAVARCRGLALRSHARSRRTCANSSAFALGKLSGGTRQRLGLALLLLPDAPVLLLDEPGLSLDPAWRKRLQETLRFEAERGKTVLVTTHLVAEWNNVAHRCLLCRDGKIERELDPTNLPHNFDEMETVAHDASTRSTIDEPHFSIRSLMPRPLRAVLLREFRDALINRYFQVFSRFVAAGRSGGVCFQRRRAQHCVFDFTGRALFRFTLRAAGRCEQRASRARRMANVVCATGATCSLMSSANSSPTCRSSARSLLLLFLPGLLAGSGGQNIAMLYMQTLLLAAAFLALGLAAGFFAHDRAQALIIGVSAWLLLAFRHRSHRAFRRALGTHSEISRSLGFAFDVQSARLFPNRSALCPRTNSGRSGEQNSVGKLVDRPRRSLVQRDRGVLVRDARRVCWSPFESLGGMKPMARKFKTLDVRPILARGVEPFSKIRESVDALRP